MKTLRDTFAPMPEILSGMDGAKQIPAGIICHAQYIADEGLAAGDGVDFCIGVAMAQASRQGETAEEVLRHLKYQRDQLSIVIANLERLPE